MAAGAVRRRPVLCQLLRVALLAVLISGAAFPPFAAAADDRKVWRALKEESGRPGSPVAGAKSGDDRQARDTWVFALPLLAAALALAALATAAVKRRRLQAAGKPQEFPQEPEEGHELERLWRGHLRRKSQRRGGV